MKKNTKRSILKSSIATTLALASVWPIAIALGKQIADNYQNQLFINSSRAAQDWTTFPNINQPTKSMFTNTSNIKNSGNLGQGIPLTPYGWLATYKDKTPQKVDLDMAKYYWDNTIALIGWDGSIIWTTNADNVRNYNSKYNFSNDVIFSIRTQDPSGAGGNNYLAQQVNLQIMDAKTGKGFGIDSRIRSWAFSNLFNNNFLNNYESGNYELIWTDKNKEDLYFQDFVTLSNGDIIWYYMPNPLKFRVKNKLTSEIKNLISLDMYSKAIIGSANNQTSPMAKCFYIKKRDIENAKANNSVVSPVDISREFFNKQIYSLPNYYLLTAPIVSAGNNNKFKIMFYVADSNNGNIKVVNSVWELNNNIPQCIGGSDLLVSNNLSGFDLFNRNSTESSNHVAKIWDSNSQWADEFNQSLLIPTRNMFDENTITFAYPYAAPGTSNASSTKVPIFNVATLSFNKNSLDDPNRIEYDSNKSKIFNFGTQIINKYISDQGWNKDPINDSVNNLLWYPWPGSHSSINNYTNQLYSRLISVSPFDNTIIYASRPDNQKISGNKDIFVGSDSNKNDYASFWIGNSSSGNIKNFYIPNSTSIFNSVMNNNLVSSTDSVDSIYNIGFWFDIYSLSITNSNNVNLYFLPTGTKYNETILGNSNNIKSSPIGVVRPLVSNPKPMNDLTNTSSENSSSITDKSYTNYITSRADLTQWFNRTYLGISKGANTYKNNDILNDYNTSDTTRVAVNEQFSKITNTAYNTNKKSIELYLYWNIGNHYNSLPVKRAKIVANINTNQLAQPTLNTELQFILENSNNWNNPFINALDKNKVTTFSYPVTISNASWQLLDSWSTNVKLSTFSQSLNTNEFNTSFPIVNYVSPAQGNYGSSFGTHNLGYWTRSGNNGIYNYTWNAVTGNVLVNNTDTPLWVEFGIDYDPENKADITWKTSLENFDNGLFTKTYPAGITVSQGATSFNTVLDKFVKWKAANLMYGDVNNPTNNIYSPGQICIKAYLKLNPYFKNNSSHTIYSMPSDNGVEVQVLYDSTNDIRYVYRDEYKGKRVVYKQTSGDWNNNSEYGFGSSVTSDITESWQSIPGNNSIFTAYLNPPTSGNLNIKDTLVREGSTKTDQMFTAKYKDDGTAIILTIKDNWVDWVKKRFSSFNQMVGRYVKFQYLVVSHGNVSQNWQDFNSTKLTDSDAKNIFDNNNSYEIPFASNSQNNNTSTLPNNIQKVRFVLDSLPNNGSNYEANRIVSSANLNLNSYSQFTSDAIALDQITLNVDYSWLNNVELNVNTLDSYLNGPANKQIDQNLLTTTLNSYENQVINRSIGIDNFKSLLKLTYSLDNNTYVNADGLYNLLKAKWESYTDSNLGIISLYDNRNTNLNFEATKIYVKFAIKNEADKDKYGIVEKNNDINFINRTNIKFFIDLSSYKNVLETTKTSVQTGNTENSIASFTPPAMTGNVGSGFLAGKSFDEITTVLEKFGITVEYQKLDRNWTTNKNDITTYDPNVREIKMRFKVDSTLNSNINVVASIDGTNTFSPTSNEISLKLNVPILVKLTEGVKNNFIGKYHISGNTWQINIGESADKSIINDIKNDGYNSANNTDKPIWQTLDQYLEVQYALSNETPKDATTFYNRQQLINHLQSQTETNYNNIIWARLHVKTVTGQDAKFILTTEGAKPFKMNGDSNNPSRNKILIYVQAAKYEQELNNIEVSGSTGNLLYSYPEVIQKVVDASSNSSNDLGIKIQYSLKQDITYSDNSGGDISNGWVDTAPTSVPAGTSSIKVRIVVTDSNKYIYGMGSSSGSPSVHSIDLNNISSLIDVDSNWFNEVSLTIANSGYLKDIQESDITTWKDSILNKSTALQTDSSLKNKVEIKFQIEGNNNWYTAAGLVNTLKSMINDYSGENLGIIYLWDGTRGLKINAKFEKKNESDKIIFVSSLNSTNPNTNLEGQVQTNQVKTYIDLSSYINVLKSNKTSVVLQNGQAGTIQSFTPPAMSGSVGGGFLHGKTYDEIANRLQTLGITFKFNNNMDNNWNTKENVNTYNQNNPTLYLGFEYASNTKPNITIKIENNKEITSTTQEQNLVTLQLLAPVAITVDLNELNQLKFVGNTKNISNSNSITTNITTIINEIKNNYTALGDLSDLHLEIRFSLNNIKLEENISDSSKTEDGIWYTFDKLNEILLNSTINYNTNAVWAKYYIKDNPQIDGVNKYILSDTNYQIINQENLTSKSDFQVYINNTTETQKDWIAANLKLTGSQENFTITNLNDWISKLPQGLTVQYNNKADVNDTNNPDENSWKDNLNDAKPIDSYRNFWIRFKVGDAYVFEGKSTNNDSYSPPFKLDASQIQVALKVQSSWLEQITLTGDLKDLHIDDTAAITQITNAGMMPVTSIIQIEYTYDGINWYIKDTFTSHLQNAAGAKDDTNWIILREDIKARFVLNANVNNNQKPKYLLEVDGTNIDEDNGNNISKDLITANHNNGVKGYINLNKLVPYQAANFIVAGTNDKAYLHIKQYNELNNLLNPYSSSNLFSILYKNDKNDNYTDANKVWTPGTPLEKSMLLNGSYTNRYFAMQFKVTSNDYELYWNGQKQTSNTLEYASDENDPNKKINIRISVAITNPLASNEINIKFLDGSKQAQWYNGEGAFQLAIQKTGQTFDSFSNFLTSLATSMPQDQKNALELVYYVANDANEEVKQKALQDLDTYNESSSDKYNVWKKVSDDTNITNLNYQLKVNDYIMLAVRIKKDQLTSDTNPNGYVLKDNNHAATVQIRAFGYKVRTDNIDVDWATLKVRNVDAAESASYGLDGYAMLDQISLKRSNNSGAATSDDYLNVSLQLNYFTEFYTNAQNQVLVSGDGSRIVKRDSTNADTDGYYKNADGQEITDTQGQPIPILYQQGQKDNGILAKPIKASSVQRSHELVETNANSYTLELNNGESNALYSFFKFQDIAIQFTNKKGNSDPNDQDVYDYYVDKPNVAKNYTIDSQIKFPIENNNLIRYTFNSEEFINYIKEPNNLNAVYENSTNPAKSPINGQSKLKYMYKVTRQEGQNSTTTELTTIGEIVQQIQTDFGSKVILKTTYTPINGASQNITSNDLSSITNLSNGDRFRIEIVSANENDLIYAQQPSPLVFTISGLYEADIDEELLQYLRVQQSGNFNGEGQFEIFVDNPYDDQDNHIPVTTLLQGYKFMVRVWNANKEVKQDWTNDYESINDLSNGDKVEWKLVAPTGAPVEKAYYNTVANMDKHNANNNTYSFSQVAKVGNISTTVVANNIGQNPTTNDYPENSGLLISGLPERISDSYTSITEEEFIRLMNVMNFGYTGINGQGNMISNRDITTIVVNTSSITREQYTMKYLIDQGYLTFYSNDIEFNWNQVLGSDGNWLISPGTLSNGDQITIKYQDPTMSSSYVWEAPTVSGLKDKSDNMSLLTYVGIGVASLATLGIFAIIYFVARNKKLKK